MESDQAPRQVSECLDVPECGLAETDGQHGVSSAHERARRLLAGGQSPEQVLEALAHALTSKFLHGPTRLLHGQGEPVAVDGERVYIQLDGEAHEIVYRDPVVRYAEEAGGAAEDTIKAPMPGTVISTPVASGQEAES